VIAIPFACLVILWQKHSRKKDKRSFALWLFSVVWIVLELHKAPMSYLPNRYMLPLYFACGLLTAQALSFLYNRSRSLALISILLGLLFLGFNLPFIVKTYQNRTHDLDRLNKYLSRYQYDGRYGLGSWAAAASWGTDLKTVPVWNDYMNGKEPMEDFKPVVVITESDESESDSSIHPRGYN